ncbi:MAG TPA: RodZ domain-containing protein [Burkholderiales bacterium]|nr:RodZ domain-containing protein [Burkholderiales bacterium]
MTEFERSAAASEATSAEAATPTPTPTLMPGVQLAQARVVHGLTLEGVAQQLKFSPRQIEALEADRYDQLPGVAVVRGMVRGYARLVGMDAAPLLEALRDAVPAPDANQIVARYREPVPFSDASKRSNVVYVVFTLAVLAVAALVLVQWRQERPQSEARMTFVVPANESQRNVVASAGDTLPVPPSVEAPAQTPGAALSHNDTAARATAPKEEPRLEAGVAAPAPAQTPTESAAAEKRPAEALAAATDTASPGAAGGAAVASVSAAATPSGQQSVRLECGEEAWVEIRDADGRLLHAQLNAAGSTVEVTGAAPLSFVIGNAQSVRLNVDGRSVDLAPYIRVAVARFTLP